MSGRVGAATTGSCAVGPTRLCGSGTTGCQGWTHAHPAEAERFGYIIPSWRAPLSVPIRDWNGDWWWLLDDGTAQRLTQIEIIEWQSNWKEES